MLSRILISKFSSDSLESIGIMKYEQKNCFSNSNFYLIFCLFICVVLVVFNFHLNAIDHVKQVFGPADSTIRPRREIRIQYIVIVETKTNEPVEHAWKTKLAPFIVCSLQNKIQPTSFGFFPFRLLPDKYARAWTFRYRPRTRSTWVARGCHRCQTCDYTYHSATFDQN